MTVTHPLYALLLLVAVILLLLAAFGVPARRVTLGWLGLVVWAFVVLLSTAGWGS